MSADVKQVETTDSPASRGGEGVLPVWLITLFFVLLYCSMVYFDVHGAWFNQLVYAPYRSIQDVEKWQPPSGGDNLYPLGRAVYNRPTCVTCHQPDGNGTPGQFPPLAGSDWVSEAEAGRLIRIVLNGMNGPITVNGKSFNGSMVPWKDTLTDTEIAAVLTYVRQNKEWGHKLPGVKPEQVAKIRAKTKDHAQAYTPEELLKISPAE